MARRGTIDKYMGDCIMAFWNAPLDDPGHADHACESALAMFAELDRVNRELAAEAEAEGRAFPPLRIGIGINTGECVVGNMGSDERFCLHGDRRRGESCLAPRRPEQDLWRADHSRRGDAGSRPILGGARTRPGPVKGKAEAVRIYALLGDAAYARTAEFQDLEERHAAMLARYRARDWAGAREALDRCRRRDARLEALYDLYEKRLGHLAADAPAADWNGIFIAATE